MKKKSICIIFSVLLLFQVINLFSSYNYSLGDEKIYGKTIVGERSYKLNFYYRENNKNDNTTYISEDESENEKKSKMQIMPYVYSDAYDISILE